MKKILNEPLTYVVLIALYCVVALFTFGYAWNKVPATEPAHFAGQDFTIYNGDGTRMMVATAASVAWPLYWSVKLQEKK